jgi:signal peptidase I
MSNLKENEGLVSVSEAEPEEQLNNSNGEENNSFSLDSSSDIPDGTEHFDSTEASVEEVVEETSFDDVVNEVMVEEIPNNDAKAFAKVKKEGVKKSSGWISTAILAAVCLFIAFVNFSWFYCVKVEGDSMNNTLQTGDYLAVDRLSKPERGDVIIFSGEFAGSDYKSYIKRIVAVGGDTVRILDGKLFLQKNGESSFSVIDERYYPTVIGQTLSLNAGGSYQKLVPEGHVFVLGDNRENSKDSRLFGCIPIECIDGVVHQTVINGKDGFLGKICECVFKMREFVYIKILKRA